MKIYLIDTENVSYHWINKMNVKKNDKLLFFYTINSCNVPRNKILEMAKILKGQVINNNQKKIFV